MSEMYVVKTIHINKEGNWNASSDAIFMNVLDALDVVESNAGDLCEDGYNQYAVVLEILEGIYPIGEEICWFFWNREEDCYEPCDRPHFADGFCFSI